MGRPSKPTHLKLLEGTREDRINRNEPLPESTTIEPPVKLSADARRFWDELAPDMKAKNVLTDWDLPILAQLCDALALYWTYRGLLEEYRDPDGLGPYVAKGGSGGVIKSPYHQMMRDALEMVHKLGSRFGMTPADRTHLTVDGSAGGPKLGGERLLS
jgi:P27 family predicted phage terminase small subunit